LLELTPGCRRPRICLFRSATYLRPPFSILSTQVEAALGTAPPSAIAIILLCMTQSLTLSPLLPTYPELLARHEPYPLHRSATPITRCGLWAAAETPLTHRVRLIPTRFFFTSVGQHSGVS